MNEDQVYYEIGRLYMSLRQSEIERNRLTALLPEQDITDNGRISATEAAEVESD